MPKDPVSRVLTTAQDLFEAAKAQADARGSHLMGLGLEHLGRLVEDIYQDINQADLAETMLVYQLAAEQVAKLTGASTADTFAALAEYCADDELRPHMAGSPPAPPAVVAGLQGRVLALSAVYDGSGNRWTREVQIIHRTPDGRTLRLTIPHELSWSDLPPKIRERLLTPPPGPVTYRLYPLAPAGEEGH